MEQETPFGLPDCEAEVKLLKSRYSNLFFYEAPFNRPALGRSAYLVVGRRGSGKTALAQYFSFQSVWKNSYFIDVDEPAIYQEILIELSRRATATSEVLVPNIVKIWEIIIWSLIFRELERQQHPIQNPFDVPKAARKTSSFINDALHWIARVLLPADEVGTSSSLHGALERRAFEEAQHDALVISKQHPIIIAIDTLEKCDISNEYMMLALAALIQCAANFNLEFSLQGIHLKVFIPGEVYPHLKESVLLNPTKSIRREPVHLLWRPKDLLRLTSWRFYRFLVEQNFLPPQGEVEMDWENHHDVLKHFWRPYFGETLTNSRGLNEHTWPYVLRHTQMRPRQLILICNSIANFALSEGSFPRFSEQSIRKGVQDAEVLLAEEILNSFSKTYPQVSRIVDALSGLPMIFPAKELDKRARVTRTEWQNGTYSLNRFRQLIAETGIVGRVSRQNSRGGFIDADFEYSSTERLSLTSEDECVIHPMFYKKLRTICDRDVRVMPFSSDRESEGY